MRLRAARALRLQVRRGLGLLACLALAGLLSPSALYAQLATGTVDFTVDDLYDKEQVTISLSDNSNLVLLRDYVVEDAPGKYSWIGFVQDDVNGRAFITVNAPNAVGTIQTSTKLYELDITEAVTDPVQEIDPLAFPPKSEPLLPPIFSHGFEGDVQPLLVESAAAACDDTPAGIDVMVLYSDDAASASIEAKIQHAIRMANVSFLDSKINSTEPYGIELKLNLVHTQMVQVNESPTAKAAALVEDFKEGRVVANVNGLRDQFAADLVFLIVKSLSGACGIAYMSDEADDAFGVVRLDCIDYEYTFTHELGHLFGANHDKYAVLNVEETLPDITKSNYGYSYVGPGFPWKTMMAYDNECKDAGFVWCPTLNFFSNPNDMHEGVPRGVEDTDNRKQLIDGAGVRACYRDRPAQTVTLNDTGIDWGGNYPSGNNGTCTGEAIAAQDCSHGRDATHDDDSDGHAGFSFTKLDADGNPLPAAAPSWSCVKDNVTGLVWEVKTDDGGLRDTDNTYTWYNPDPDTNGGNPGTQNGGDCIGSDCDTFSYVQAVNAQSQSLCGARDWRMPWREELRSVVDYSRFSPAIDTAYFPNERGSNVWSGSPYAGRSDYAWYVQFLGGSDYSLYRYSRLRVRLVRAGQ